MGPKKTKKTKFRTIILFLIGVLIDTSASHSKGTGLLGETASEMLSLEAMGSTRIPGVKETWSK